MPTQLLVNVVTVTLGPLASTAVAHGLKYADKGVVPTQVICDRASPIKAASATTSTVTFTNLSASIQTAQFRIEYDHSIHAVGATPNYWQGYAAPVGSAQAVYGSFTANVRQALTTGVNLVNFDTTEGSNGVSLVSGNRLQVAYAGVYSLDISPQLFHGGGGTELIKFWLRVDGSDVPRSASSFEMGNNNNRTLPFVQIDLPLNAGQYIQWAFTSSTGTDIALEYYAAVLSPPAAFAIPAIPAVIANVKRIGDLP